MFFLLFFALNAVGGFTNVAAERLISSDCSLQMYPEEIQVHFYLQLKLIGCKALMLNSPSVGGEDPFRARGWYI